MTTAREKAMERASNLVTEWMDEFWSMKDGHDAERWLAVAVGSALLAERREAEWERDKESRRRSNASVAVVIAQERIAQLEQERDEARALLRVFREVLPGDCRIDHNGNCQEHWAHLGDQCAMPLVDALLEGGE